MVQIVRVMLLLAFMMVLVAACSSDDVSDDDASGATGGDDTTSDTTAPGDSGDDAERPSIVVASAFLPGTLDPAIDGYSLIQRGVGETLTRVAADQSIEPWLADSVELIEGAIWEIVLRDDVTFWDGEPLSSEMVVESIERNWDEQPASRSFLPMETEIDIVDDQTIRLTLPEPDSALPHNLAVPQLVIHRVVEDEVIMTGPYMPVALRADDELELEAYDDYWAGRPPIQQITIRRVADGSARELAVQSGDADMVTEASPESAAAVSGDVASVTVDSTRIHYVMLNHQQAPFDDIAVREAINLGIDRDELNQIALGGLGAPTTTLLPPELGVDTPDQLSIDPELAGEILDDAGWELSDNGIRMRDGDPLQFELLTYPGRPELTPMAVSIQEQLGRIGINVSVQEVDDIGAAVDGTDFQASIYSMNMLPNGDPAYALGLVGAADGGSNYGGYQRDEYDALLDEIRLAETDEERAELIRSAQQLLLDDHVSVFLIAAPRAVVYRADRLDEPDIHPSEMYFIHLDVPQPLN